MSLVNLPPELICNIVSYLPNNQNLASDSWHEEPPTDIVESQVQTYRALSHVCQYLRQTILRTLFNATPVVLKYRPNAYNEELRTVLLALEEAKRYLSSHQLSVANLVVRFSMVESPSEIQSLPDAFFQDTCSRFLQEIKPKSLTIVLPSQLFPFLSSPTQREMVGQDDSWAFDMPLHVLRLSCPRTHSHPTEASLWGSPWSNVTLNEGSSLKAYSTYEFYSKQSPSVFLDNTFCEKIISSTWSLTIREFEYVAIFPLVNHMSHVLSQLKFLTNLATLSMRLAPHEDSAILSDPERVGAAQYNDLWLGLEENYASIARAVLYISETHRLRKFRALDCVHPHVFETLYSIITQCLQGWEFNISEYAEFTKYSELAPEHFF